MKFRPKSEDTRNFLKIKAGESIEGVFRGDPYEFRIHWENQRSVLCVGSEKCVLCKAGNKNKFRFRVNFIVKEEAEYQARVMEMGWTFYEQLRNLDEELKKEAGHPLEQYVVKVSRHGEKLGTKYTVLPKMNGTLSPEAEKKMESISLNELGHITEAENEPPDVPGIEDGDIPF